MSDRLFNIMELSKEAYGFHDYQKCYDYAVEAIKEDSMNYEAWGYKALAAAELSTYFNRNFSEVLNSAKNVYSLITSNDSEYFGNTNYLIPTTFIVNIASAVEHNAMRIIDERSIALGQNNPVVGDYYWILVDALAYMEEFKRLAKTKKEQYMINQCMLSMIEYLQQYETDEQINQLIPQDQGERNTLIEKANEIKAAMSQYRSEL